MVLGGSNEATWYEESNIVKRWQRNPIADSMTVQYTPEHLRQKSEMLRIEERKNK
jgi:hypothetical protein